MAKRLKVPRASLAVTMLDDSEFIALSQTPEGREAVALFCSLLMAAKNQDNDGKFDQPEAVMAMLVRWPLEAYKKGIDTLSTRTDWLVIHGDGTCDIRSFAKWNSWGGDREGSGRPPLKESSVNQDGNQDAIKIGQTVSVSVTDLKATTLPTALDKPKRRSWAGDWEPTLAKLLVEQGTAADRCKLLNHAGGIAGKPACETLLRELEGRQWVAKDCGHAYAYLTSALKAKVPAAAQSKVSVKYQRGDDAYGD